MADSDVIGGIENLTDAVSGETPSYEYKNPNTDMMKAISKCIDAADGTIGSEYHYDNPNTDVIQKMDELADAIATHSGGGSSILITKTITENDTYKASDDSADGYSEVTVNVSSGSSFESVLKDGVVSTSSSYATASFSDISNYKNVVIRLKGTVDGTYYENINFVEVSKIGNGISLYFCLGKVIYVSLTKTSIGVYNYSGNYYYMYADVAGTEDDINIFE